MSQIVHAGLDESGALTATTSWFVMAVVVAPRPKEIKNLIQRVALHSGTRLKRERKAHSELKWRNASQRVRRSLLSQLAFADVTIYSLAVRKQGRRIADIPENYAALVCELLQVCWRETPNVVLSLDRHFTSPTQIATVNTTIHRHWPAQGVLSISHVDSEHSPLVQLADFVAGSAYEWYKSGDPTIRLIESKVRAAVVDDWPQIKARWAHQE